MKLSKISLRELFWLVTLVAMGCGWWMDHRHLSYENSVLRSNNQVLTQIDRSGLECHVIVSFMERFLKSEGYAVEWHAGNLQIRLPSGNSSVVLGTGHP